MKNRCPVFQILSNMLHYDANREKNTASLALIYAVLMFRRCHELSCVHRINTVLLAEGNENTEVSCQCDVLAFPDYHAEDVFSQKS